MGVGSIGRSIGRGSIGKGEHWEGEHWEGEHWEGGALGRDSVWKREHWQEGALGGRRIGRGSIDHWEEVAFRGVELPIFLLPFSFGFPLLYLLLLGGRGSIRRGEHWVKGALGRG